MGLDSQTRDSKRADRVTQSPISRERAEKINAIPLKLRHTAQSLKWVRSPLHDSGHAKLLVNGLISHRRSYVNLRHCDLFAAHNLTKRANRIRLQCERARHLSRRQTFYLWL